MASSETTSRSALRIIDANLNRIAEGIRLLEDIARLLLDDGTLTRKLKTMRHEMVSSEPSFQQKLLEARDANRDVGMLISEDRQRELPILVVANSRRVQESLRTIEELAKLPDTAPGLDPEKFKQARFSMYVIEQELFSRLLRQDKKNQISGLYLIIDTAALKGRSHAEVAAQAIKGGVSIIQLRDKMLSKRELLPVARELRKLCASANVLFIINDYLDLALATDADGLHLGQHDLPVEIARRLLPADKILGCSTTSVEQAKAAQNGGADYIAIGAMYPTSNKETAQVVGLTRLKEVRRVTELPIVAIGGITGDNIQDIIAGGANAVAVINAILSTEDIVAAVRKMAGVFQTS